MVDIPNHSSWITCSRSLTNNNDHSKSYYLYQHTTHSTLFFSLKDILNCKDIGLISFFNNDIVFFMINIYSDDHQLALKYLKDTKVNIHNMLIMSNNFIIRDRE